MKIAIVGTGISGLGAAYLLNPDHDVHLYEKNTHIGGHSRTIDVKAEDTLHPVDTGFIVFNYRNYPHLTGLFNQLDVPVEKSDMSFGVSIDDGWLEYGTQNIGPLFSQKRNLLRPAFVKMVADILRFNKHAPRYLTADNSVSLGQCLDELGMGAWFRKYYLLAVGGAIWSTPLDQMLAFPAQTFIRFFANHGLLTVNDQPQWYTVSGGSREYVSRLTAPFKERIRTRCGVSSVYRDEKGVTVKDASGNSEQYDQIIFACHSDQALAMLENPSEDEQRIIGAFRYQPNRVIVHSDTRFMPKRRACWASWVYVSDNRQDARSSIGLTYWMNRLQNLQTDTPILVTLNPDSPPDPATVQDEYVFEHPIFDQPAIDAQSQIERIQGKHHSWYCGAYQRYGFHEDGLLSAVRVAEGLGAPIPWS